MQNSTARATITTSAEMINPCIIGLIPDFFISDSEVFSPIAARAQTIKNLLTFFVEVTISAGMGNTLEAITIAKNPKMNHGKIFVSLKFILRSSVDSDFANASFFFKRKEMKAKVITVGIIASVLVNFTIVAKSPAASEAASAECAKSAEP